MTRPVSALTPASSAQCGAGTRRARLPGGLGVRQGGRVRIRTHPLGWEKLKKLMQTYSLPIPRIVHLIRLAVRGSRVMRQRGVETLVTEEPYALIAHVRVCGGAGWVTTGSTRKLTASSVRSCVAPASSRSSGPALGGLKSLVLLGRENKEA
jgi:hypothetical protein